MTDITKIIEIVFSLIALLISSFLIPYIKSKLTIEKQAEINMWVKIAVNAAEQLFSGSGRGEEKKNYVIEWLSEHKIKYDSSKIDTMIESAVYEIKTNGIFTSNNTLDE